MHNKFDKLYEEFHDAFNLKSWASYKTVYIEIFKNPTPLEIESILKSNTYYDDGVRLLGDNHTGDVYAFSADALHEDVEDYVDIVNPVHITYFKYKKWQIIINNEPELLSKELTDNIYKTFPDVTDEIEVIEI